MWLKWHLIKRCLCLLICLSLRGSWAQQTHIKLDQGDLIGLKVFPDGARNAVYAFLGIPYAQPPVGSLRFAPAKAHSGWNRTLQAMSMQPLCPQLSDTIYDESADGSILARAVPFNEDCLYLNIWTPETGLRYGQLPMLVIITGEDFAYDWPRNRINGLDFAAAENVVVVSIQYRSNIYGWLGLGREHRQLPGNYGLSDIQLALRWIHSNANHFGGNAKQITLLGHGSGALLALANALESKQQLKQLILMSPGAVTYALDAGHQQRIVDTGRVLVQKLGCQFEEAQRRQLLLCLRRKSSEDLLRAYESVYNHGNGSLQLGVQLSNNVPLEQHLANASLPPLLLGISSNEGALLQDYWLHVAREGADSLHSYINQTLLPNVLRFMQLEEQAGAAQLAAIRWRYFNDGASVGQLLWGMQRLLSESLYETPFLRLLQLLQSNSSQRLSYAYIFDQSHAHAMDMRGRQNLFGGASHSSDLPLLLGPSLFQQISRRRFNVEEEQLCRKLRGAFASFIKGGNPTPGRIYDAWLPYTLERPFVYSLGELAKSLVFPTGQAAAQIEQLVQSEQATELTADRSLSRMNRHDVKQSYVTNNQLDSGYDQHLRRVFGFWQVLLPAQEAELREAGGTLGQRVRLLEAHADAARYRQGFYAMLGLVCLLLACLGLCVYLLRRDPLQSRRHSATASL
ncbi:liver carboxylesterase 2 [Drosophila busckii]|uniref:liver carboxylesterase 2 n=1 Tax=Drosophila busckii TaxID=30019 RepID=UPI00083F0EBE|nr:liver carboxylesterase 2 [Drosophila busckii]